MSYEPQVEYKPQGDWGGIVQYGSDKQLVVMFYMRSVHNPLKSQAAGTRFHDEIPYVKIHHPGERDQVIDRPVTEDDKRRFPNHWKQFSENREQVADGVPIDLLFPTHPAIADNLRSYGIHTIEQCADMSAHALGNIGLGAQDYKNRAKDYMDAAGAGANYHKFAQERQSLQLEVKRLKEELATLSGQFSNIVSQIKQGVLVPSALVPQQGVPGMVNFQPVQSPANSGLPLPGEPQPAMERRNDMMAQVPKGRISKTWGDKK